MDFDTRLEDQLNEEYPLVDYVGTIADEAKRNERWVLYGTSIVMTVLLVVSMCSNFFLYNKPAKLIYIRLDEVGRATPVEYSGIQYTPMDGEIMQQLYKWSQLRFSRIRSTVAKTYNQSYFFIDGNYASVLMQKDNQDREIAKTVTGELPESDVNVQHVQITGLGKERFGNSILYGGTATIPLEIVSTASAEKEHKIVSVKFYLNPASVGEMTKKFPDFVYINPLGVVITEFHVAGY